MPKNFKLLCSGAVLALLLTPATAFAAPLSAKMYKNPDCTCCEAYAQYLRQNGVEVTVSEIPDLHAFNHKSGVPDALEGCHTMFIAGYVIEGHVPMAVIRNLLAARPKIRGISIPGMPTGVPGMAGPRDGPINVYEISDTAAKPNVFASVP